MSNLHQKNYALQYSILHPKNGAKSSLIVSKGRYELGKAFEDIGATGMTTTIGVNGHIPILKTASNRLAVIYGMAYRDIKDELRTFDYKVKKHSYTINAGISGNSKVGRLELGYGVNGISGRIVTDDAKVAGVPFLVNTEGRYTKANMEASLSYKFTNRLAFVVKSQWQQAANNLDSSEQFYLGGPYGVRAYPQGEASGDEGYQTTAELRYITKLQGVSVYSFFDMGHVKYYKQSPDNGGVTLKGYGLGLAYDHKRLFAHLDFSKRIGIGDDVTDSAKAKQRVWFIAGSRW